MQRTAVWVVTSAIALTFAAMAGAQPATDPTMRVLDDAGDVARVLDELDGRRAETDGDAREPEQEAESNSERGRGVAVPPPDRAGERRRPKLDDADDERGESALDDDDVARDPPPVVGP